MEKIYKVFFFLLASFLLIIFYQPTLFAQENDNNISSEIFTETVVIAGEKYQLNVILTKKNTDEDLILETDWLIISRKGTEHLSCQPNSFIQVSELKVSPDGKFLAIVSVGEGHPILDIVDLPTLLIKHECKTLISINPYPSYIDLKRWTGNNLIVKSEVLLTHKIGDQYPINLFSPQIFAIDPDTEKITALSITAKSPTTHFINMLSDEDYKSYAIESLVILKAKSAIPYLEKMLLKESNSDIQEQIRMAIIQLSQ